LPYQSEDLSPEHLADILRAHWPLVFGHGPPAICEGKRGDALSGRMWAASAARGREVGGQGCLGRERCATCACVTASGDARSSGEGRRTAPHWPLLALSLTTPREPHGEGVSSRQLVATMCQLWYDEGIPFHGEGIPFPAFSGWVLTSRREGGPPSSGDDEGIPFGCGLRIVRQNNNNKRARWVDPMKERRRLPGDSPPRNARVAADKRNRRARKRTASR